MFKVPKNAKKTKNSLKNKGTVAMETKTKEITLGTISGVWSKLLPSFFL